jgi:nitroreductase
MTTADAGMQMDTDYLLTATGSARRSLDLEAPVDLAEVRDCLRIGLQAANGTNQQSWRWIVVADATRRKRLGELYREAYLTMTKGEYIAGALPDDGFGRVMSSTEWLVDRLGDVPLLILPCYQPYLPKVADDDESFQRATLYGSIFPPVWNFQLALHTRGYGTCITTIHLLREREVAELLDIPDGYVQACLLPVGRLRVGHVFGPAARKPIEDVVSVDAWGGPPLPDLVAGSASR